MAEASHDLATAIATLVTTAQAARQNTAQPADLIDALALLRRVRDELADLEPTFITAARQAGVSWQALAPALGVASRQAAERRYLRAVPTTKADSGTRDDRVRAERDRRAGQRAVDRWANDNTAGLRRLAGQVTALTDLADGATDSLSRLHTALGDSDAAALPALLAETHPHLAAHPDLAAQIDDITSHTDQVRERTQRHRDDN